MGAKMSELVNAAYEVAMADMIRENRIKKRNRLMRELYNMGYPQQELAINSGMSRSLVQKTVTSNERE